MEPTASDPAVQQQYGMIVGIPNAGQLRALGMLNVRGERSVTCKGDFDRHPSKGPLPAGAPAVCEEFRKQPDALERAAELDAQYGRNPDLAAHADVLHPVLVQGPVRHQGHAVDRRRRRALRHRLPGARPDAGGAAAGQGRHHLRQGQHHRVQRPRRQPGRHARPDQGPAVDARATSAARGPATRPTSTTRRAPPRSARARARASRSAPTW